MIEFHADDYGLFPAQSARIKRSIQEGACNGISIMPNSPHLKSCMQDLGDLAKDLKIAVHLNLVEGGALSPRAKVSLLTDEAGIFRIPFTKLLLVSLIPGKRKAYRRQIAGEFKAQIQRALPYLHQDDIRLDAHVHYHLIPVVFDAMMDAVFSLHLDISYIRIPREILSVYLDQRKELTGLKPINLIKVLVLNLLALYCQLRYHSLMKRLNPAVFSGVFLSGHMSIDNVRAILPGLKKEAQEAHTDLEVLFHPGSVLEREDQQQITNADDFHFLKSPGRKMEEEALLSLHK